MMKHLVFTLIIVLFIPRISNAVVGGYEPVKAERDQTKERAIVKLQEVKTSSKKIEGLTQEKEKASQWYDQLSPVQKVLLAPIHAAKMVRIKTALRLETLSLKNKRKKHQEMVEKLNLLQVQCIKLECDAEKFPAYIIAVSGRGGGYIEKHLNLESELKDLHLHYRQANWHDLYKGTRDTNPGLPLGGSFDKFIDQIKLEFQRMPKDAKVILIGHSLGGAAILKGASVADEIDRSIELLVALDPVGEYGLRLNITHTYADSLVSSKRTIPKVVSRFVNRWQTNARWPVDYRRSGEIDAHPDVDSNQEEDNLNHNEVSTNNAEMVRELVMGLL